MESGIAALMSVSQTAAQLSRDEALPDSVCHFYCCKMVEWKRQSVVSYVKTNP